MSRNGRAGNGSWEYEARGRAATAAAMGRSAVRRRRLNSDLEGPRQFREVFFERFGIDIVQAWIVSRDDPRIGGGRVADQ